jgi:ribosome-associated heat shock protein Hsp15
VRIAGAAVKSSHAVSVGDEIHANAPRGALVLEVRKLEEKRQSPPLARTLYEDHTPPAAQREPRVAPRERGSGRPTKAERRALDRFRRDGED